MIENKNSLNEHETIVAPFKPDEEEPYIFISYSHKDRNRVFPIITRLYEKGWRIWYDEGIEVTENYYTSISRHIRKCTAFLLFVTENSVKSEFVCEHELLLAASYRKIMAICRLDENAQFTDEAGDAIALATISSKNPKTDETGLENALSNIAELKKFPPRKAVGYKIRRNNTDIILADEDDEYDFEVCGDGIRLTGYNGNAEILYVPQIYKDRLVVELSHSFTVNQNVKKIYIPKSIKKYTLHGLTKCNNLSDIYVPMLWNDKNYDYNSHVLEFSVSRLKNCIIHYPNYLPKINFKKRFNLFFKNHIIFRDDYYPKENIESNDEGVFVFCDYSKDKKEQAEEVIVKLIKNNCSVISSCFIQEKEKNKYFRKSSCMIAFISKEYVDDNEIEFIYRANEVGKDCILFYLDDIVLPDDLVITMKHKQYLHYKNGTYEDRITKLIEWIEMHGCEKNFFNITNYDYSTDRNGDITLTRYVGTEENVVIPDIFSGHKVVSIGRLAFHYCLSVKHIIIPKSVISIDEFAFAGCQNLTSIVIPNTVTNIGKDIFIDSFPKGSLRLYEVEGNLYDLYKFVVYCNENSYAWKYCEENNIPHKPMEEKSNDC